MVKSIKPDERFIAWPQMVIGVACLLIFYLPNLGGLGKGFEVLYYITVAAHPIVISGSLALTSGILLMKQRYIGWLLAAISSVLNLLTLVCIILGFMTDGSTGLGQQVILLLAWLLLLGIVVLVFSKAMHERYHPKATHYIIIGLVTAALEIEFYCWIDWLEGQI